MPRDKTERDNEVFDILNQRLNIAVLLPLKALMSCRGYMKRTIWDSPLLLTAFSVKKIALATTFLGETTLSPLDALHGKKKQLLKIAKSKIGSQKMRKRGGA